MGSSKWPITVSSNRRIGATPPPNLRNMKYTHIRVFTIAEEPVNRQRGVLFL